MTGCGTFGTGFRRDLYSGSGWERPSESEVVRDNTQRFGIQVGVSINFFIKRNANSADSEPVPNTGGIFYTRVDEFWRKEEKYRYLEAKQHYQNIEWQQLTPDNRYTWLTEGLHAEFDTFLPMGSKKAKARKDQGGETIFGLYSLGVATNRDALAYSFDIDLLQDRVRTFIEIYNTAVDRERRHDPQNSD